MDVHVVRWTVVTTTTQRRGRPKDLENEYTRHEQQVVMCDGSDRPNEK